MKKLITSLLILTVSVTLTVNGAKGQTPKDQIALQLGAIQMGYNVPFAVTASSNSTQKQRAVNALVMGRNAMNATATQPAVTVKGVVNSPNVNTVQYRDQLYSAVEYVVTSPVNTTVNGTVIMSNNTTISVASTMLRSASNDWTTPVPYALEARSSIDAQELRAELVAAGLLTNKVVSATSKSYFVIAESVWSTSGLQEGLEVATKSGNVVSVQPVFNSQDETFQTWLNRRLSNNDRITIKDGNFWATQKASSLKETLNFTYNGYNNSKSTSLRLWYIQPITEPAPTNILMNGITYPASSSFTVDSNGNKLIFGGQEFRIVTFFGNQSSNAYLSNIKVNN